MSLSSALNIATKSLELSQQGIATSANNLANIDTPGYVKQIDLQESVVVNGVGQGAQIIGLSAAVDQELLKSIQSQTSSLSNTTVTDTYYTNIQNLYGQPNADNSISSEIDAFFSAYQALSNNPETPSLRSGALNASKDVASKISSTANSLQEMRYKADKDIGNAVENVNSLLENLVSYNVEITKFTENTSGYVNVKQKMNETLSRLSESINILTSFDQNGKVSVSTGSGISLIDDATNARLQYIPASSSDVFKNETAINPIRVTQLTSDGEFGDTSVDLATEGTSAQVTTSLTDGSIKALIDMRDDIIPGLLEQLDTLASAFANAANAVQNNGGGFPPQSTLTGTTSTTSNTEVDFTGSVRIAVINSDGTPASSPYSDEDYIRPLTIDLASLNGGAGPGRATVQTIIDEINDYYGPVQNRASVGNLRNIQIAAVSDSITDAGSAQFDLVLDNTSVNGSTVVIQSITVVDPIDSSTGYTAATLPTPNTYTIAAGDMGRTGIPFTVNFGTDDNRASYTVRLRMQVTDSTGVVSVADVDYTVGDSVTSIKNDKYNAAAVTAVSGTSAFLPAPDGTAYAHAALVDSDGVAVSAGQLGVLKITTSTGGSYSIVIDEMDSKEIGVPGADSADITNRGLSHYFGLNNLFVDNGELHGAALNMAVRADIKTNANLLSAAKLTLSKQPVDPLTPLYTYELGSGNNEAASDMAAISNQNIYFAAAGDLPNISITFSGYSGDVIGSVASNALNATSTKDSKQLGMDGLQTLFHKAAGVNSDEELSHIIELQNHFGASAQVINVVQELFRTLSQAISN